MPSTYTWNGQSSTAWATGANWTKTDGTTGTAPVTGDTCYIQYVPGLALPQNNIAASDNHTVVLAQLIISPSWTGTIGNATEPGGYLQIGATILTVLPVTTTTGTPNGSGRIKIDEGSTSCTINIASSGQLSADAGLEPIRIIGSAIAAINVSGGTVGIATSAPGETATVTAINCTGAAIVNGGPGVSWTTATAASGVNGSANLTLNSGGGTTATSSAGATLTINGTTAVTTINGGGITYVNIRSGGTDCTTLNLLAGGTTSFANNPATSTITTINAYLGSQLVTDPAVPAQLTTTNPINRLGSGVTLFQ